MCVYVYIQICTYTYITPFLTSLFTLLSEKTQQRKIRTVPHMETNRESRGVGLQIPVPASEPCISLCVRKACVCVRVVKGGVRSPLYQQLDWAASPASVGCQHHSAL